MQRTFEPQQLELDQVGKFCEFDITDMIWARVQARIVSSNETWGGAVLRFHGTVSSPAWIFHELDTSKTLSAAGITAAMDVTGLRRFRIVVATASSTSGALVEINLSTTNPYQKEATGLGIEGPGNPGIEN